MVKSSISTVLKKRRKELGLTYQEISARSGVNKATVQNYFNGSADKVVDNVADILGAMNCKLNVVAIKNKKDGKSE